MKTKDGYLLGAAGSYGTISMFFNWFQDDDEDKPGLGELKLEQFEGIIVHPEGDVVVLDPTGFPMEIDAPFHTLGSGSGIAHGAMAQGASAIEAVKIAIKWVPSCGGAVQSVRLKK